MITATIFEAKTKLSQFIRQVQDGETVVITSGREKTPVARLEPMEMKRTKRLGFMLTPGWTLPADFDDPLPEEDCGV